MLSKKTVVLSAIICVISIILLLLFVGTDKIKSDISRLIHNSSPKNAREVYTVLFKKSPDSCVTVINFKDQIIPKFDCCIWMELEMCPNEFNRILTLRQYKISKLSKNDSLNFINAFSDKPSWWNPQNLGDSITKYHFKFNQNNEQTIFVGDDKSHVYLCDQAL